MKEVSKTKDKGTDTVSIIGCIEEVFLDAEGRLALYISKKNKETDKTINILKEQGLINADCEIFFLKR